MLTAFVKHILKQLLFFTLTIYHRSKLETEVKLSRSHGCLKVTAHEKLEWRDYEI
jgi:hypothetical protein